MPPPPRRRLATLLLQCRTFLDVRVPWARDRALDHAVAREQHLLPFLLLKDLLVTSSPPPHSLSLACLSSASSSIPFPFRPIRFIRLFPSAFSESTPPPPSPPIPTISPTPSLLSLHNAETQLLTSSLPDLADRLLRLLMLSPTRRLPIPLVDSLCFDLGLPADYVRSVLPHFPDYFNIVSTSGSKGAGLDIEVVCYRKDLAVSAMERYAMRTGGYKRGDAIPFPLSFPRGFELEKKVRKWVDEWQRLPYLSPYEDGSHLMPRSDAAEKRTVAVLHEVLSLLVGKKVEKEKLVKVGERLRLPPGFRKVIVHHPGIFYVSNKLRTQTVMLREAYRRHMLVDKHPVMGLRYQYLHLMHMGKEDEGKKGKKDKKSTRIAKLGGDEQHGVREEEEEEEEEYKDFDGEDYDDNDDEDAGIYSEEDDDGSDDDDVRVGYSGVEETGQPRSRETREPTRKRRMAAN